MSTFSMTPVQGFPPPSSADFPQYIQWQIGGTNIGGTDVATVNFGDNVSGTLDSSGTILTLDVAGGGGSLSVEVDGAGAVTSTTFNFTKADGAVTDAGGGVAQVNLGAFATRGANTFTGTQTVTPVTLVDASPIGTNANQSNNFLVTLNGAGGETRQLANPTNLTDGAIYNWYVKQGANGDHLLTFGSDFKFPGGTAPTLSTAVGAVDLIVGQYMANLGIIACNFLLAFA